MAKKSGGGVSLEGVDIPMHTIKDLRHERDKTLGKVSPAKLFNVKDSQKTKTLHNKFTKRDCSNSILRCHKGVLV